MIFFSALGGISFYLTVVTFSDVALGRNSRTHNQDCKAIPGTADWPQPAHWQNLNQTLSGRLLSPIPPGGVCHKAQANYNNASCASVVAAWTKWDLFTKNPVGTAYNNWNNDTCLPDPAAPCSASGYPAYIVDASTPEHVRLGVNFANKNRIRLIVKGSGHDFRGRSVAPNSLSIWVHHIRGLKFQRAFRPKGCRIKRSHGAAITAGAGENHAKIFAEANKHKYMLNVGAAPTVGLGGYSLGGGHSAISFQHGLAADNILELKIVLASGKIVVANSCQQKELFWAIRGGGGSTLGVVVETTLKVFPSERLTDHTMIVSTAVNASASTSKKFWNAVTYLSGQAPRLAKNRVMYYAFVTPASETAGATFTVSHLGLKLTPAKTARVVDPIWNQISSMAGRDLKIAKNVTAYPSFYAYWSTNPDDTTPAGVDLIVGSRILDEKALRHPNFNSLIQEAHSPQMGIQMFLVGGPGTHKRRANFNSVTPAWRTGYVHVVTGLIWPPFDEKSKQEAIDAVTNKHSAALRKLAPDMGSYQNEVSLGLDP
jgi:FAD binding domain